MSHTVEQQSGAPRQTAASRVSAWRFLSEVLLYPEDRDQARLRSWAQRAARDMPELSGAIETLLASPELEDTDLYLATFEIAALCPLYLGHYLFEEPKSCSGAAMSGRNHYMIQLKNLYRHFGFELEAKELPDYLPLMLEFLALSAGHPAHRHRRMLIKDFMLPALPALCRALRQVRNVYSPIAGLLEQLLNAELETAPSGSAAAAEAATVPSQPPAQPSCL